MDRGEELYREDSEDRGLYAALSSYSKNGCYPYHMPGHKRSALAGDMARYFDIDITEIDGFDDLHQAEGILRDAMRFANELYGAEETFYLVNGSTCGVLASIMTAAERGTELLVARNCHRSVYHAAILQELTLRYCYPPILEEYGICDGVSAEDVGRLLEQYPGCRAVVVTSPTYEGIVSDIRAIAEQVHARGRILIVDEAHGAHLALDENAPEGAVAGGADLIIHSLHKTLPSMTQTALLHVQGERVDRRKLRAYLRMLQTGSPSYVLMAGMDSCMRYMRRHGRERFALLRRQYDLFCEKMETCRYIRVGRITDLSPQKHFLSGWDIGKLTIFVRHPRVNGRRLYDMLREDYRLQMEMAAGDYVLAMMTVMDDEESWQRLADALVQIDDRIEKESAGEETEVLPSNSVPPSGQAWMEAEAVMSIAQAFEAERTAVPLAEAEGRTAADFVNLYPPGVPLLVPGELISGRALAQIDAFLRMGLRVQGVTSDGRAETVSCVRDGRFFH